MAERQTEQKLAKLETQLEKLKELAKEFSSTIQGGAGHQREEPPQRQDHSAAGVQAQEEAHSVGGTGEGQVPGETEDGQTAQEHQVQAGQET